MVTTFYQKGCKPVLCFTPYSICETYCTLSDWERPAFNLGRVFLKSGYTEEALATFKEAEKRNPDNEDVYFYLGSYYYETKDYVTAKVYYEKSISINDEQAETHLNLGRCYYHLGMNDKAIQEFNSAYKYDRNCLDAIYNKGVVLIYMSMYQEGLGYLLAFQSLKPDDIEVMMDIAHCYYKLGNYEHSKIWIDRILSKEPEHNLANKLNKRLMNLSKPASDEKS